jgi:hypothetical protein
MNERFVQALADMGPDLALRANPMGWGWVS